MLKIGATEVIPTPKCFSWRVLSSHILRFRNKSFSRGPTATTLIFALRPKIKFFFRKVILPGQIRCFPHDLRCCLLLFRRKSEKPIFWDSHKTPEIMPLLSTNFISTTTQPIFFKISGKFSTDPCSIVLKFEILNSTVDEVIQKTNRSH